MLEQHGFRRGFLTQLFFPNEETWETNRIEHQRQLAEDQVIKLTELLFGVPKNDSKHTVTGVLGTRQINIQLTSANKCWNLGEFLAQGDYNDKITITIFDNENGGRTYEVIWMLFDSSVGQRGLFHYKETKRGSTVVQANRSDIIVNEIGGRTIRETKYRLFEQVTNLFKISQEVVRASREISRLPQ
jgi:hypothetical protein